MQAPLLPLARALHEPPGAPPMPAPRTCCPRRSSAPDAQIPLWGSEGASEEPPGSEVPSSGSTCVRRRQGHSTVCPNPSLDSILSLGRKLNPSPIQWLLCLHPQRHAPHRMCAMARQHTPPAPVVRPQHTRSTPAVACNRGEGEGTTGPGTFEAPGIGGGMMWHQGRCGARGMVELRLIGA